MSTINNVYVMSVVNTKPQFIIRVETIVIGSVQKKEINSMYIEESIWGYVIMIVITLIGLIYQEIKGVK